MENPEFLIQLSSSQLVSPTQLAILLKQNKLDAYAVFCCLVRSQMTQKTELCKMWSNSLRVAYVELDKTIIETPLLQKLPEKFARQHKLIPLYQMGECVSVAMAQPTSHFVIRQAEQLMGLSISPIFSWQDDIEDAIEVYYQSSTNLTEGMNRILEKSVGQASIQVTEDQLKSLAGDQSVIEFTRSLLLLAVKERASDIHVEPTETMSRVRFRIDGVLQDRLRFEKGLHGPIITRIKILASVDIVEKRRPQDGRILLTLINGSVDFRFSSVPTIYGEKVVLRVLGQLKNRDIPEMRELCLSANNYKTLKRIADSPNGVFFVTGPTGSGKTTTLYSVLKYISKDAINVMTIEDPVEYRLAGINQIQVNPAIALDFASALRSFLRQDPDVVLVGEVRDAETAKIASQAALTGHFVLTTLHTNNALQAVTRLIEIGVEPFLVAPSIIGVMAQRLVRKICDCCKESYRVAPEQLDSLFEWDGLSEVLFYRGKGCQNCKNTGYYGRLAIQELLVISEPMRRLIANNASILEIEALASRGGFKTMRRDGLKKVLRGLTTLAELERVILMEEELGASP